jgi:putative oxidoreductase
MIVAVAKFHAANGLFMNWFGNQKGEGFEYHLLALALLLVLVIRGAGALSLDRLISGWWRREGIPARRQSPAVA